MENFFYDDIFCETTEDLMTYLELEPEELYGDWEIRCQAATLEKMFTLEKSDIVEAINEMTRDDNEERFPEDYSESIEKAIRKAISDGIDIDKINAAIPELYYPNGEFFTITKSDLV